MTIRSIKICHLESDSALKALRVHLAERTASKGRESAGQPVWKDRGPPASSMGAVLWVYQARKSSHHLPLQNGGTGQTKLVRLLKRGDESMGRENEFGVSKVWVLI